MHPPPSDAGFHIQHINDGKADEDIWMNEEVKVYIPSEDNYMQLRICVASNCGLGGN